MHIRLFKVLPLFLGILASMFVLSAAAQYPDKPIKMIVAWPPGDGTDAVARIVVRHLGERLKQPVVIEKRAGANAILGAESVLKSPPAGHDLVVMVAAHVINSSLQSKMPYDPVSDVAPVTLIARSPWVIVVTPSLPQALKELVAYAKANPGKLRFGSSEPSSRLAGEQFKQLAGINLEHIAYEMRLQRD